MYFQNKKKPISEKITVLNGIDVLLEKKLHFIQSRKIALVQTIVELIKTPFLIIND
jgi:hypothetical protein